MPDPRLELTAQDLTCAARTFVGTSSRALTDGVYKYEDGRLSRAPGRRNDRGITA